MYVYGGATRNSTDRYLLYGQFKGDVQDEINTAAFFQKLHLLIGYVSATAVNKAELY